jgi:hypothetical protein
MDLVKGGMGLQLNKNLAVFQGFTDLLWTRTAQRLNGASGPERNVAGIPFRYSGRVIEFYFCRVHGNSDDL